VFFSVVSLLLTGEDSIFRVSKEGRGNPQTGLTLQRGSTGTLHPLDREEYESGDADCRLE
jgi:hypothetical protein